MNYLIRKKIINKTIDGKGRRQIYMQGYNKTDKKHKADILYRQLNQVGYDVCLELEIIDEEEYGKKGSYKTDFLKRFKEELKNFRDQYKKFFKKSELFINENSEQYQKIMNQLQEELLKHKQTESKTVKKVKKQ